MYLYSVSLKCSIYLVNTSVCVCVRVLQDDLEDKCVSTHELSKFAKDNGFFSSVFISVKEAKNIDEMMK